MPDPILSLKAKVVTLLSEAGLSRISSPIQACIKDSLILNTKRAQEEIIPFGQTKIGGAPDLPPELGWPTWKEESLSFIAQINLAELPDIEFVKILHKSGILYFFYSAEQATWGYDPNDKGSWRVLYGETSAVRRREFPKDLTERGKYQSFSATFSPSITIPSWDTPCIEELDLSTNEHDRFIDFSVKADKIIGAGGRVHRLLGHPDQIQNDMQLECQLVSNGLYCGNSTGYNDPRALALRAGAKDWELLLQIDSDDDATMMWGDVGKIYYWIPRNELRLNNFEATWMILQCY